MRVLPTRAALLMVAGGLAAVMVGACTSQPVILPSRDFDRPTDVTFVCMETVAVSGSSFADADASDGSAAEAGAGSTTGDLVLTGRPMRVCHPRDALDGQNPALHTFAFLPNSSSGDLSVIDADRWHPVNLDPPNAGYARLPLGVLPSQITASDDGCRLVTANHGSCDLSFVDPAALLAPTVRGETTAATSVTTAGSRIVTNVVPVTKSGRTLRVLPGEVSFLPMATPGMTSAGQNQCSADASQQWQALATFPSCDLVALIDLPSGIIRKAAYARRVGGSVALVPVPNDEPQCPIDCTFDPSAAGAPQGDGGQPDANAAQADASATQPDGGASAVDAGATPDQPSRLLPSSIAISPESGRAYVGLANAGFVLALRVGPNALTLDTSGGAIPLHQGALGVNRLRLSIDPYKDKVKGGEGKPGAFIGNETHPNRQYLYVIARDGTVAVVSAVDESERECETNLDFSSVTDPTVATEDCPAINPLLRRPGATGPAIRLPTPPVDVAVADIQPSMPDNSETSVAGVHAWILTATGTVYLVNIEPVLRHIFWVDVSVSGTPPAVKALVDPCLTATTDCLTEPAPPPNTLRNRNFEGYTVALDPSSGLPRLDVPPSQASTGPRVETIWTLGSKANATATSTMVGGELTSSYVRSQVFFPDPSTATPQTWAVTWEGNLLPSPRLSGQFDTQTSSLKDLGADFCRAGVQPDDIVTLLGCTNTNQCGIGKTCVLGSKGSEGAGGLPISGLCLPTSTPTGVCDDLLSTVRRYDVTDATQMVLGLTPHKDELVLPSTRPCTPIPQTGTSAGADGGADAGSDGGATDAVQAGDASADASPDGGANKPQCVDSTDPNAKFQCLPFNGSNHCLQPCDTEGATAGCRTGRICLAYGPKAAPKAHKKDATGNPIAERCDDQDCFCADGPSLTGDRRADVQTCLGELFPYQVGVGRGFVVSGTQAPIPTTRTSNADQSCKPLDNLDPRLAFRIPMNAAVCHNLPNDPLMLDSRCDPDVANQGFCGSTPPLTAQQLLANATTTGQPNPCLFEGGPNETDFADQHTTHTHALFRNREVQFVMTNLEQSPAGVFQIRFDVHGGFQPQVVALPSTVEVTMPIRLVLGPFDSNPQQVGALTNDIPYLFVVDQRRLGRSLGGGPTRGQLLRIHPLGFQVTTPVTGFQPWYEDLSHSGNLFPIQ